jgi:hypothetical protein
MRFRRSTLAVGANLAGDADHRRWPPHHCSRYMTLSHWIRREARIQYRRHALLRLRPARPLLHRKTVNAQKNFEKEFNCNLDRMIRSNWTFKTAQAF